MLKFASCSEGGKSRLFRLDFLVPVQRVQRAEVQTRTADIISLRVITQALQGCAQDCKSRIFKRLSVLWIAACATVLRSRWYRSAIRTSDSYSPTAGPMSSPRDLHSHNPLTPVSGGCPMLHNRLS